MRSRRIFLLSRSLVSIYKGSRHDLGEIYILLAHCLHKNILAETKPYLLRDVQISCAIVGLCRGYAELGIL
jgi:hypothetical protein